MSNSQRWLKGAFAAERVAEGAYVLTGVRDPRRGRKFYSEMLGAKLSEVASRRIRVMLRTLVVEPQRDV